MAGNDSTPSPTDIRPLASGSAHRGLVRAPVRNRNYEALKQLIHRKLVVDHLSANQARVMALSGLTLRREVRLVIERLIDTENPLLNGSETEQLIKDVLRMTLGEAEPGSPWWA